MLYQLHAKVFNVDFVALIATCHADLLSPQPEHLNKNLSEQYWRLKAQTAKHQLRGISANFTYPWPMIEVGFDKYQALNLFNTWKSQSWSAFIEDRHLISSPLERKSHPSGPNLYESLTPIRRVGLHALLMVKVQPDEMSFSCN